jgi:hypothetical protein
MTRFSSVASSHVIVSRSLSEGVLDVVEATLVVVASESAVVGAVSVATVDEPDPSTGLHAARARETANAVRRVLGVMMLLATRFRRPRRR